MADRRTPTAAERSEALIHKTAQAAVQLALTGAQQAQEEAVQRALRDARVDRDLAEHRTRLDAINGSQKRTADELTAIKGQVAKLANAEDVKAAVENALERQATQQSSERFSKRTLILGAVAATGAYSGLIALLIVH